VLNLLLAFGQFAVFGDNNLPAGDGGYFARRFSHNNGPRIPGDAFFKPRRYQRSFRDQQGHRLPLHVGPHQRAIRVVMLQKRNQAGGNGNQLFGRDIHVIHPGRFGINKVSLAPANNPVGRKLSLVFNGRIRLRNNKGLLAVRRKVVQLIGNTSPFDFSIGSLQKPEVVDAGKCCQGSDQTDVRPFRRLHGTYTPVMRRVHVAHLKPCPIPRKPPGSKGGQPPFVRQLRQRVDLIHELRKLAAAKEIADDRRECFGIDELLGRHGFHPLIKQGHPLFDQALRAGQTHPALVGEQLPYRAHPPTAQVINVIQAALALLQAQKVFCRRHKIRLGKDA